MHLENIIALFNYMVGRIFLETKCAGACQHRAHRIRWFVCSLALNLGLGAGGAGDGGARWAGLGFRAVGGGATRTRAGRALTNLAGLRTGADARRARWDGGLQHILGHVGLGRALRLEHVARHIGHRRTRGHRCLQNPLAGIRIRAAPSACPTHGSFLLFQFLGCGS
jgi:hypothetical protein